MKTLFTNTNISFVIIVSVLAMTSAQGCKKAQPQKSEAQQANENAGEQPAQESDEKKPAGQTMKSTAGAKASEKPVIAKVGDIEVRSETVEKRVTKALQGRQTTDKELEQIRARIRKEEINSALVHAAAAKHGITVTPEDLKAEEERHVADAGGRELYNKGIQESGMTPDEVNEILTTSAMVRKLVLTRGMKTVTDEAVRAEYDRRVAAQGKSKKGSGPRIRIAEIVIKVDKGASPEAFEEARIRAENIRKEIDAGLPFDEAAKRYSQGPTAKRGGIRDEPMDARTRNRAELIKDVMNGPVGLVFGPGKVSEGWAIGKVLTVENSQLGSFEEEAPKIRTEMSTISDRDRARLFKELATEIPVTEF